MACLDTSMLIDLCGRGGKRLRERARRKLRELTDGGAMLVTTRFSVAELWVGVFRASDPEAEQEAVGRVLGPLPDLDFDAEAARAFARLTAYLQERATPVGDMDVLIGAVALLGGHPVITRNKKHFDQIPGLACETY